MKRNNKNITDEMEFCELAKDLDDVKKHIEFMKKCSFKYGTDFRAIIEKTYVVTPYNGYMLDYKDKKIKLKKDFFNLIEEELNRKDAFNLSYWLSFNSIAVSLEICYEDGKDKCFFKDFNIYFNTEEETNETN